MRKEKEMSLITDIQKYSIHDGDGIRTTVFFKGCALRCQWCHNPETQNAGRELLCHTEPCVGCGACAAVCPAYAVRIQEGKAWTDRGICTACGRCTEVCNLNLREIAGKEYTVDGLVKELKKDEMFYEESGGGVTLSGGEVMLADMDFVVAVAKKLKAAGIHVAIDTCGYAPRANFERLLPFADLFLYDIKTMDTAIHKKYMGFGNEQILENLEYLNHAGADIYIRIPTIKGVNADEKSMRAILSYLKEKQIRVLQVNLLAYHNTGSAKYARLGRAYEGDALCAPSGEEMQTFADLFQEAGYKVKIGG